MRSINLYLAKHKFANKALLHLLLLLPLAYCTLAVLSSWWGGDPVQAIIHYLANAALNILLLTLVLAPLSRRFKLPSLLAYRRMIGLYVAFYALLHVLAYWLFDLGLSLSLFVEELIQRPYIWLGMLALLVLLVMSVTSISAIQRKMGKRWLQVHGLIFPISLVIVVHFWWSVKSGWFEPALYALAFSYLLIHKREQLSRWLSSFASRKVSS